ncbi:MAG TPA: tyrosine-type recombinase/integrase [Actinocrinis sp.]|uniref:tyrosine-type recombinase/integrase n=1 Tax=Actinocrinis sp. TaxID=1920516 RepID=UPI002DDD1E33|nr:tyrosine-type recombinase/integrase [Actinocrinis sp.]HEV2343446.1 tyrosine-type recombinase/integrase [Actinocrinis sp.]
MTAFVADQRHRAKHGLPSLGIYSRGFNRPGSLPTKTTAFKVGTVFDGARRVLRFGMENGHSERIGLGRAFIVALPPGGVRGGRRRPFPDQVARALADQSNLATLEQLDTDNRGLRDIWEALVLTGRRTSEVLELRLECLGTYNGLPMFWHDQTKVGNYDDAIRIPDWLYQRLRARQNTTCDRFAYQHGRLPNPDERQALALFPRRIGNRRGLKGVSYSWFQAQFQDWVDQLDIDEHCVPHQARHTLATNLLRHGAGLAHIKRYLGHVSERMSEHYIHLANIDPLIEDALTAVWVTGPGSPQPGKSLSDGEPMTRQQAEAIALDLARRSTPADGGFCTYQPVVNGAACPWNLDYHNCDKFVMSGADLVYWHRKREQWHTLAERAPDTATADFLHDAFEPTARAIDGLEKALAAVGLLEQALSLDLRRPQDYFGRVWSTAFRAQDLARHNELGTPDGDA